ncbi:MAG: response regulator [Deltaproteobacteria bacterium]|nr:response regulator [Deltaproteobacteria bacterium]MBW2070770.1 response regulator [Deltaproteobacteria bacterium]
MATALIVDRESDTRQLLRRILRGHGHQVFAFANQQDALAWANSHRVDLAIVELEPEVGLDYRAWLTLKQSKGEPKVLTLSRYFSKHLALEALAAGTEGYFLKPVDIEELEFKVNTLAMDL